MKIKTHAADMRFAIKSRTSVDTLIGYEKLTFRFWLPGNGGYIRLEGAGSPGPFGNRIADKDGFALSATPDNFEKVCRQWYRRHMRLLKCNDYNGQDIEFVI